MNKQTNQRKPLWIDPQLQHLVKVQASMEGRTLREVTETLLKKWLDQNNRAVA